MKGSHLARDDARYGVAEQRRAGHYVHLARRPCRAASLSLSLSLSLPLSLSLLRASVPPSQPPAHFPALSPSSDNTRTPAGLAYGVRIAELQRCNKSRCL